MVLKHGFRKNLSGMDISDCIHAAKCNLYDSRRYLETGEAVNWVPDSLGTALLWAMEAWLMAKKLEVNHGKGWNGTREAFWNAAPTGLHSPVMSYHAKATFLEYDLKGSFDHQEQLPPMEVWKASAFKYLEEAETVITLLIQDA